jgi:aminoglycoside 3-N-acetyltransferase
MDEPAARDALLAALSAAGVRAGDVAYLGVDMSGFALPRRPVPRSRAEALAQREEQCAFLLDVLRAAVGPEGTLLAPSFSYAYARHGTPYVHETSPSELSPFTEHLRTRPGTLRSFHPLFSVCGAGPAAAALLEGCGRSAYGPESPFGRLAARHAKFVGVGVRLAQFLTYAHHLEQVVGVNHAYHKVYNGPAFRGGVEQPGPWLAFVRYLGIGVELAVERLEERVRAEGALREQAGSAGLVVAADVAAVERIGCRMLAENPWAFVAEPVEVHVDAPGAAPQPTRHRTVRLSHG